MVVTESGDGDYGGGKSDNHGEGGTSDGDVMWWSRKWWQKHWECGERWGWFVEDGNGSGGGGDDDAVVVMVVIMVVMTVMW